MVANHLVRGADGDVSDLRGRRSSNLLRKVRVEQRDCWKPLLPLARKSTWYFNKLSPQITILCCNCAMSPYICHPCVLWSCYSDVRDSNTPFQQRRSFPVGGLRQKEVTFLLGQAWIPTSLCVTLINSVSGHWRQDLNI